MKIVIAPDSFKESLDARKASLAIASGMKRALPNAEYHLVPMADGGEGTVDAFIASRGGHIVEIPVTSPLGGLVTAFYGVLNDGQTAVVEIAAASGLSLVPAKLRDPVRATSFGTGELIRAVMDRGMTRIVIGLGGSATNDGGIGMLQALGARFYTGDGQLIDVPIGADALLDIAVLDLSGLDPRLEHVVFEAMCDVDIPLTGPDGASIKFGPQKGANASQVNYLERGIVNFYQLTKDLSGIDATDVPRTGAAGGLGGALFAFLNARLLSGVEEVIAITGLTEIIRGASVAVTGEGRVDAESLRGKVPFGVARVCAAAGIPVVAIGGSLAPDASVVFDASFDALEAAVVQPMSLPKALSLATCHLEDAGERVAHWLVLAERLGARFD